jgi:hypothetical protein
MTPDQAAALLRSCEPLTQAQRDEVATTFESEVGRLRGVIGRNRQKFLDMKEALAQASRDRDIYKGWYEAALTKLKSRVDGKVNFDDLFGGLGIRKRA